MACGIMNIEYLIICLSLHYMISYSSPPPLPPSGIEIVFKVVESIHGEGDPRDTITKFWRSRSPALSV